MASYRGHVMGSVALSALATALFTLLSNMGLPPFSDMLNSGPEHALLVGTVIAFGLWPDVDTNSIGRQIFYPIFFIAALIFVLAGNYRVSSFIGLFAMLPALGKHRGWTHTRWAAVAVPSLIIVLPLFAFGNSFDMRLVPYFIAAVIGYLGHLFQDGVLFK